MNFLKFMLSLGLIIVICFSSFAGQLIYFVGTPDAEEPSKTKLYSVDLEGKNFQKYDLDLSNITQIIPAPKGQPYLLMSQARINDKDYILVTDLKGKILRKYDRISESVNYLCLDQKVSWAPDGKSFIVARINMKDATSEVVSVNVPTGKEKVLMSLSLGFSLLNPSFSPDGNKLAVACYYLQRNDSMAYMTQSVAIKDQKMTDSYTDEKLYDVGDKLPKVFKSIKTVKAGYFFMPNFFDWSDDGNYLSFYTASYLSFMADETEKALIKHLDKPNLYIYDVKLGQLLGFTPKAEYISMAKSSPSGRYFVYLDLNGATCWDGKTNQSFSIVNALEMGPPPVGIPKYWSALKCLDWVDNNKIVFNTKCQIFVCENAATQGKSKATEIYLNTDIGIESIVLVSTP